MWRISLCVVLLLAISLNSQTTQTSSSANSTFKVKAQLVLVDVTVTNSNGHPVTGLKKDDFEIFESADLIGRGEEQLISSFEEHKGAPPRIEPPLPLPNFYTNAPSVDSADSINVLLLDALNTPLEDQAAVRHQMIKYLKTIDPGPRLAIFTLDSRLRMVEGFSSDPRELIDALKHRNWGGAPHVSSQAQTAGEGDVNQKLQQQMVDTHASTAGIQALQAFLSEEKATEQVSRVSSSLGAIRLLCRYLSGFPGRKNLIWFSESFPTISVASLGQQIPDLALERELKETLNLLASGQVAVYPVAAQGVETDPLFQANQLAPLAPGTEPPEKRVIEGTNQSLVQSSKARAINAATEDEIASDTGGQAFYDNGLKEALAEAVKKGSYYYSLSYSPTDKKMLGRYRRIEVKLRERHYKLAYRRGYFEEDKGQSHSPQPQTVADPLQPLMRPGLPDATQIIFNLRVLRTTALPAALGAIAGDNNKLHDPFTRFTADFVVPLDNLDFEITSDGVRHGRVELALVAYDHDGHALNWLFRSITTSLKPELYPLVLKAGGVFHQDIDVPPGENYLRAGIYDLRSNQAGTLELPLSEVQAAVAEDSTEAQKQAVAPGPSTSSSISQSATTSPNETNSLSGATAPETTHLLPQSSSPAVKQPFAQDAKDDEIVDIPVYCAHLSRRLQHSSALANVCRFALFTLKRFPNLICQREMKRNWIEFSTDSAIISHSDVLAAQVTYRDGQEYYDHLLLNGQQVSSEASVLPPSSLRGPWSVGEFGMILHAIFLPASEAEFQFKKQTHIGPAKALVFTFHVAATNNRYYFLFAGDKKWFPQYRGELWIDEDGFHLLRLERETGHMADHPIRSVKTTIQYAPVSLSDGSTVVLPINSAVKTCTPLADYCSSSLVRFTDWHKFKATTKIVTNPLH